MKLYEKIAGLRRAAGLTQEKLGALLGVSPQAVSKWENDECLPDLALLPDLCRALHVSADALLDVPPQPAAKGKALVKADSVRIAAPAGVTLNIEGVQAVQAVQSAEGSPLLELLADDAALRIFRALGFHAADEAALAESCCLAPEAMREALFHLLRLEIIQCTPDGYALGANAYLLFAALSAAWLASPAGRADVSSITTSYSTTA